MRKGRKTEKAPQNQNVPGAPRTVVFAFVGGLEIAVVNESMLGPLHEGQFDVPGGSVILRWPLKFTPKIIESIQASYDDAVAAGALTEGEEASASGLVTPSQEIWTP